MSFIVESADSATGKTKQCGRVDGCGKIKLVGNGGLNFQVYDDCNTTIVNATAPQSVVIPAPPINNSPPIIRSSNVTNGILTVRGFVKPNAKITIAVQQKSLTLNRELTSITNKQGFPKTIIADSNGNFTFTAPSSAGTSYKVESEGESSYVYDSSESSNYSISFYGTPVYINESYFIFIGIANNDVTSNYTTVLSGKVGTNTEDFQDVDIQTETNSLFTFDDTDGYLPSGTYIFTQTKHATNQVATLEFNTDDYTY